MTNNNIFLGSGASVTFVPEVDFTFRSNGNVTDSGTTVTLNTENVDTGKFLFVNNLYQGCTLEYYAGGRTANPASSSASGTLGSATVTTAGTQVTAAQAIIENGAINTLGSMSSTGAEVHLSPSAHSTALTFAAADGDGQNYGAGVITIQRASAAGDSPFGILFDAGGDPVASDAGFDEFVEVSIASSATAIQCAVAVQTALNGAGGITVSRSGAALTITNSTGGYVGSGTMAVATGGNNSGDFVSIGSDVDGGVVSLGDATIINAGSSVSGADSLTLSVAGTNPVIAFTTTGAGDVVTSPTSIHRITSNTSTTFTFSPAITTTVSASADFFVLKRYGAPLPAPATSSVKRLAADNWLGVVDSLTFPENEIENKQVNLMVGGSRNYTYQYKGIETAGATDLGVMANHGAWLYYFFGKATVDATLDATDNAASDIAADVADKFYLNPDRSSTGNHRQAPLFYRSIGTILTPPVSALDDQHTDLDELTAPTGTATSITNPITYTMTEEDGDNLPSFSLEQSFSKLSSSNTYRTETGDADETENFVRIARGNRVNTLNLTANENEELKMSMNCMVRSIHNLEKTESYEARRGVTDETSFINYDSTDSFREPFFFSDGQIKMFGQSFLKITSFSLAMNNTLTDKRFIGIGSRGVKDAIPAQRTYEMTFSAMVTDDGMYNELVNTSETTDSQVELVFTKGNGEKITLKFSNYFLTSNSWPMPEDKGAVTIEGTIQARSLHTCEVITHWILQG